MNNVAKRSALQFVITASSVGTAGLVLVHYMANISPISGIWFPLYILTIFLGTLYLSFKFIQHLLLMTKPIQYDWATLVEEYPYLPYFAKVSRRLAQVERIDFSREYDTNELSIISTVLEKRVVSAWYLPYISEEISFPFACKQLLDQMISKTFEICGKIESQDLFVDACTILTCHLKEYRKAMLRFEKTPANPIVTLYKKSHSIFDPNNQKLTPADHCTNIIRIVMKEIVPWELWDTPHSELLVRILSKKLYNLIDTTITRPAWLNDQLLTLLEAHPERMARIEAIREFYGRCECYTDSRPESCTPEPTVPLVTTPEENTNEVKEQAEEEGVIEEFENIIEEVPVTSSEPMDIKASPILRQRRGRQGRNEVKIYDRIIEGSVKTWDTDIDLQCISMGQDLLASLDGEITLSRLWGQDADTEGSPNPPRRKSPQPLWFGEEETIEVDPLDSHVQPEAKKELSPKPAELLKDIQSTVSQAKKQIGDLQVEGIVVDVTRKLSSDEAAGMMEGLLDFGIAGIKKGLRFTGLSDDLQEKSPSHQRDKLSDKSPPPEHFRGKPIPEHKDVHANGHKDVSENVVPQLVKQHRVTSQDSVPSQPKPMAKVEGVAHSPDSPEPEYEEAADLSTSIAKLRCLLEQRAETSSSATADDIWWESAEETRGRTQQHHSSKPVDTATLADEYDMNMDRNASPNQSFNNMQRLDKLFTRTVTGVFNSIKTAVGAEDEPVPQSAGIREWTYVSISNDLGVSGSVARLVGSRRAYAHVDAALDSLDQLPPRDGPRSATPDDFEEWCATRGARFSALGALAGAAGLTTTHVVQRLSAVMLGAYVESMIEIYLIMLTKWIRRQVFVIFSEIAENEEDFPPTQVLLPEMDVEETSQAIMDRVPGIAKFICGTDTVEQSVKLAVNSISHQEINRDVAFRLLDLFAGHFKKSAAARFNNI